MTRFLVVTPVLNGAQFIRETLESVRSQTDDDWIHYLVDGGSVDGSLEIIAEAAEQDHRRRVITGTDRSLFDAWFKGFEHAAAAGLVDSTTICVWLGSDDLLMPWAFATLRDKFDRTGAQWVSALPSIWGRDGRVELVQPFNWYPRRLIRAGLFHNRCLGGVQMESVFFTHALLSRVPADVLEAIRIKRLAGDFLLWREFARHARLVPIMTVVAGFRWHGANLSTVQEQGYFREISESGGRVPPRWLGRILRAGFRQLAILMTGNEFRLASRNLGSTLSG